jgi:hypothetical protein
MLGIEVLQSFCSFETIVAFKTFHVCFFRCLAHFWRGPRIIAPSQGIYVTPDADWIWGSNCGDYEEFYIVGCNAVKSGARQPCAILHSATSWKINSFWPRPNTSVTQWVNLLTIL